jgi:hypothetical protein
MTVTIDAGAWVLVTAGGEWSPLFSVVWWWCDLRWQTMTMTSIIQYRWAFQGPFCIFAKVFFWKRTSMENESPRIHDHRMDNEYGPLGYLPGVALRHHPMSDWEDIDGCGNCSMPPPRRRRRRRRTKWKDPRLLRFKMTLHEMFVQLLYEWTWRLENTGIMVMVPPTFAWSLDNPAFCCGLGAVE